MQDHVQGKMYQSYYAHIIIENCKLILSEKHIFKKVFSTMVYTDGYVGKQPVAWKEYCADYWLKEIQIGALAAMI